MALSRALRPVAWPVKVAVAVTVALASAAGHSQCAAAAGTGRPGPGLRGQGDQVTVKFRAGLGRTLRLQVASLCNGSRLRFASAATRRSQSGAGPAGPAPPAPGRGLSLQPGARASWRHELGVIIQESQFESESERFQVGSSSDHDWPGSELTPAKPPERPSLRGSDRHCQSR